MQVISRAEWGARPPKSIVRVPWSKITGVVFHYSGADKHQTVRSIQDHCMDNRGFADIDYNFVIGQDARIYEGRGWNVRGSHVKDFNTPNVGICFIGEEGDITPEMLAAGREVYDEACRRKGSKLTGLWHAYFNKYPGSTGTDCPGKSVIVWVKAGMPVAGHTPAPAPGHPAFPGKVMARTYPAHYDANVKTWQARMKARGWKLAVDGEIGPETQKVAGAFQAEKGLKVTKTINRETWDAAWTTPIT